MKWIKALGLILITSSITLFISTQYSQPLDAQTSRKLKLGQPLPENLFVELARVVRPSVVNISTSIRPQFNRRGGRSQDPFFNFFEQFMGPQQQRQQGGMGTGFIIRQDGLILTNAHVISDADVIQVQLASDESKFYEAELIGQDQRTDIALIKINANKKLPAAELGTSKDLEVGEWVTAIGNPFGHGHTVTKGIVSAIGREIGEINRFPFIQTDASINPGNSGGPLINSKGQVIGVNSAIDARAQGIGFAIPIDEVKSILPALEKEGRIRRAFLGVNMYPYPLSPRQAQEVGLNTTEGALIIGVLPDTPAKKAGIQEYDMITKVNGKRVRSSEELSRAIQDLSVGKAYDFEIIREGKTKKLKVKLGDHPENAKQATRKKRNYSGQKAPFELGFNISDYSKDIANSFGQGQMRRPHPIVTNVKSNSPASRSGLNVGDAIVDVNRKPARKAIDVLKALKKGQINTLRILRSGRPYLIYVNPKTN